MTGHWFATPFALLFFTFGHSGTSRCLAVGEQWLERRRAAAAVPAIEPAPESGEVLAPWVQGEPSSNVSELAA